MNLDDGAKEQVLPGRIMGSYDISRDGTKVVFTSIGTDGGDGVWIADVNRQAPPRQLTRGGEFRAFFGLPGEIIYLTQGQVRYLAQNERRRHPERKRVSPDPVINLIQLRPTRVGSRATVPEASAGGGTSLRLVSTKGDPSFPVCRSPAARLVSDRTAFKRRS